MLVKGVVLGDRRAGFREGKCGGGAAGNQNDGGHHRFDGTSPTARRASALLPFRGRRLGRTLTELPYPLGSAHPCPTAVHKEPFPTSVLKVLI